MNRRTFLKTSLTASAAPFILPSGLLAAPSPNQTMNLGIIGTGRMGHSDMKSAMTQGMNKDVNARIVAVCDLNSQRAEHARDELNKFYQSKGEKNVKIDCYGDFRQLLARKDIDAVIIATPDHWHALCAIAAANARKHIYLEKPLTYSIAEGQALVKAVRANNVTLQTGSQQRSSFFFRQACTIIRNNWLGELKAIEVTVPTDHGSAQYVPMEVPANLNYKMWMGPTEPAPYTEARVHPQKGYGRPGWLQIERYCRGMITGWGAHMYDIAQWGMGTDLSGPTQISAKGEFPDRGLFNVHVGYTGIAHYSNGVKMTSRAAEHGTRFITDKGWVFISRSKIDCSDSQKNLKPLLNRKPTANEITLPESKNHMANFLLAARAGKDPICPVEIGHRSNTVCVLHHISMKLHGRNLQWDPQKETFINDPEANAMLSYPMREPWTIG